MDGQSYNVNNTVLLRDEGRYKLGYLLKIYCRTKVSSAWYYHGASLWFSICHNNFIAFNVHLIKSVSKTLLNLMPNNNKYSVWQLYWKILEMTSFLLTTFCTTSLREMKGHLSDGTSLILTLVQTLLNNSTLMKYLLPVTLERLVLAHWIVLSCDNMFGY